MRPELYFIVLPLAVVFSVRFGWWWTERGSGAQPGDERTIRLVGAPTEGKMDLTDSPPELCLPGESEAYASLFPSVSARSDAKGRPS